MRLKVSFLILLILVGIDQLVKGIVSTMIPMAISYSLIPGVISLTNIHNSGAAWSILQNQQWFFIILALLVSAGLIYYLFKHHDTKLMATTIILLLAGTLGNGIDRFIHGYVVDMFQLTFINFPIFNVADVCLTFGVILLFGVLIKEK